MMPNCTGLAVPMHKQFVQSSTQVSTDCLLFLAQQVGLMRVSFWQPNTHRSLPHPLSCHRWRALDVEFDAQVDCSSSGGVEVLLRDQLIHKCRGSG